MLLKCRFLSQFSVSQLTKNAAVISKASEQCPFMKHAYRTLATTTPPVTANSSAHAAAQSTAEESASVPPPQPANTCQAEQENVQQIKCTNTINCPFFNKSNFDLNKLIVEKKTDNSDEISHHHSMQMNVSQAELKDELKLEHGGSLKRHASRASHAHQESAKRHHAERHHSVANVQSYLDENNLFSYDKFFGQKIADKKKDGSYRYFKKVLRKAEKFPFIQEHTQNGPRDVTIWCSNDYLGLGRHPYVQSRICEAVMKYGAGSGGTRNISGSTPLHDQLELELAQLHQKEAALLFTSCYVANDTTLFTMAKMLPNCHILSDAGNHASMIQGIRNSAIPKTIFRHNDYRHLEEILQRLPASIPKIVAFESVHSMDGSICDMERMCDVTHKYGGIAYVDEVHAVGLYGENGGGVGERDNMLHKMDIITGTLGKAFGNIGGYIAGSSHFVDTMRSYGAGFIFTTSLPPSVAAGTLASLEISRSDEGRQLRATHQRKAAQVKRMLMDAGLPVMNNPSHIVPVMVGNVKQAGEICDRLMSDYGIYIQSINYPTVARGEERLRIVPNPHHTEEMINYLVDSVVEVWQKVGLPLHKSQLEANKRQ